MLQLLASSSFLPACNYSVIAQSGIVGVDVYTQAIVQGVVAANKTQICIANARDRSGLEQQVTKFFLAFHLS